MEPAPETTTFSWDDQEWTIPAQGDAWPFEAVEAMEQGKALTFVRLILGPEQMRRFTSKQRTAGEGADLMRAIIEAAGGKTAGE